MVRSSSRDAVTAPCTPVPQRGGTALRRPPITMVPCLPACHPRLPPSPAPAPAGSPAHAPAGKHSFVPRSTPSSQMSASSAQIRVGTHRVVVRAWRLPHFPRNAARHRCRPVGSDPRRGARVRARSLPRVAAPVVQPAALRRMMSSRRRLTPAGTVPPSSFATSEASASTATAAAARPCSVSSSASRT